MQKTKKQNTVNSLIFLNNLKRFEINSFHKVLMEVLQIDESAVYRRTSGETSITFNETLLLLKHYKKDLNALIPYLDHQVQFTYKPINAVSYTYDDFLKDIVCKLQSLVKEGIKHCFYFAKEHPLFYNLMFAPMGLFKYYVWEKSFLSGDIFEKQKFSLNKIAASTNREDSLLLANLYLQFDTEELWGHETINITIQQIEHYYLSDYFESKTDALAICKSLKELLQHIQLQVEYGFKVDPATQLPTQAKYHLYVSELTSGDNKIVITSTRDELIVFDSSNTLQYQESTNEMYCSSIKKSIQKMSKKAMLLNNLDDKEKNKFFTRHHKIIDMLILKIETNNF